MATCGHHYPIEGCHNCWLWIEGELDEARAVLDYLEDTGAVSPAQINAAADALEDLAETSREAPVKVEPPT